MFKMKLLKILLVVCLLLSPTFAKADVGPITKNYGSFILDTTNEFITGGPPWDITKCDLTISYTLYMGNLVVPNPWETFWAVVGVGGPAWGFLMSGAPGADSTDPLNQDLDDKHVVGRLGDWSIPGYNAITPDLCIDPFGHEYDNYGFYFDRDGVSFPQESLWGFESGGVYDTGGIYDIELTFHAISSTSGTIFARINGVDQGFYLQGWHDGEPDINPAGKCFGGDLSCLYPFAILLELTDVGGEGFVILEDLSITGCSCNCDEPTPTPTWTPEPTPTITATPDPTPTITPTPDQGCTLTQGYWKNHATISNVEPVLMGGVFYTQQELIDILNIPPAGGDATYILAHQLITAKWNLANGASGVVLGTTVADADAWLIANPLGSDPSDPPRQGGIDLSEILDAFNNGDLPGGPPHCDDEEED